MVEVSGEPTGDVPAAEVESRWHRASKREALMMRLIAQMYEAFDAQQIVRSAVDELARFLDVDRAIFARIREEDDLVEPIHEFRKPDVPSAWRTYRLSDYAGVVEAMRRQGVVPIHNVETDPAIGSSLPLYRAMCGRSILYAPIRRGECLCAILWFAMTSRVRTWTAEEIALVRAISHQIGLALCRAELYAQARELEQRYRTIFENAVVGIYRSTPEGKLLMANPALVRMLGYDSVEDLQAADIERDMYVDVSERRRIMEILHRDGHVAGVEFELRRKDGERIVVREYARAVTDEQGRVLYYEGLLIDVTEQRRLQQQLLQAQRLESIGTLAAGIAHNFNNLLTVILGYASLLAEQVRPEDPAFHPLHAIEQAAQRAAELTAQLLLFARPTTTRPLPLDVNDVIQKLARFLRGSFDASISVRTETHAGLWPVLMDPAQLEQVLMNLCVNARDAMPGGGVLILRARNVSLSREHPRVRAGEIPAGKYVVVEVSDTGVGMTPDQVSRIFDPFYTTKEVGQGTGLGLAVVYGLVRSVGGFIDVQTRPGQETTFALYFPAAVEAASSRPEESASRPSATILLVDDEPAVRRVTTLILAREGYDVLLAADGVEALEIYRERQKEIAVVILDVTMPRLGGLACYEQLVRMNPEVKVILSSGYALEDLNLRGPLHPHVRFVQKPYRIEELLHAVRALVVGASESPPSG